MPPIRSNTPIDGSELTTRPPINLPNEILDLILDNLGDHKPTFARCMRTSLQMYQVAAPRLYTHLKWRRKSSFPLATPSNNPLILNRKSPTKTDLFQLIRTFVLENHGATRCPRAGIIFGAQDELNQMLSIPVLTYNASGRSDRRQLHSHLDSSKFKCPILLELCPRKLVVHASHIEPLPLRCIDRRNLTWVVTWVNLRQSLAWKRTKQKRQPFGRESPVERQVVYILSDMASDDDPRPLHGSDPILNFRAHLKEVMYKPHFATNVLIVNGAGRSAESVGATGYSCVRRFARLERDVRDQMVTALDQVVTYWRNQKGGGTPLYKSVTKAESTRIQFIDSREYLAGYDTEGGILRR